MTLRHGPSSDPPRHGDEVRNTWASLVSPGASLAFMYTSYALIARKIHASNPSSMSNRYSPSQPPYPAVLHGTRSLAMCGRLTLWTAQDESDVCGDEILIRKFFNDNPEIIQFWEGLRFAVHGFSLLRVSVIRAIGICPRASVEHLQAAIELGGEQPMAWKRVSADPL